MRAVLGYGFVVSAVKGGRSFGGEYRERGRVVHGVAPLPDDTGEYWGGMALCGGRPRAKGQGWSRTDSEISCDRCLLRLNRKK